MYRFLYPVRMSRLTLSGIVSTVFSTVVLLVAFAGTKNSICEYASASSGGMVVIKQNSYGAPQKEDLNCNLKISAFLIIASFLGMLLLSTYKFSVPLSCLAQLRGAMFVIFVGGLFAMYCQAVIHVCKQKKQKKGSILGVIGLFHAVALYLEIIIISAIIVAAGGGLIWKLVSPSTPITAGYPIHLVVGRPSLLR